MQKDITTFHLETSLEYTVKLEIPLKEEIVWPL